MPLEAFDLTGKVGLVTGGNAGLGLGYARGMAKAGADVVIWGRRADVNEQAAEDLRQYGRQVLAQQVDVSDEEQVRQGMLDAVRELGRVDCVVANAGFNFRPAAFHEMRSEDWHAHMAVNLHGSFYTLREGVRHMMERAEAGDPGGSLIACGSLLIYVGFPQQEHYGASKAGVAQMIRSIAVEYGQHGIRANVVAVGYAESGLARPPEVVAARAKQMLLNPIPRAGLPSDLEGIAVYLMSDASKWHTGDIIVIDGGAMVKM
jgi:NAD(P)-dependent dehydrogenase (short-subunit alcohol dehydrogenase family)